MVIGNSPASRSLLYSVASNPPSMPPAKILVTYKNPDKGYIRADVLFFILINPLREEQHNRTNNT